MRNIASEISEFKTNLMNRAPFYGEIYSHINIVEDASVDIAATDGRTVYYNKRAFSSYSKEECRYILMHELFHIIFMHTRRMSGKNSSLWNVAADYVVNGYLDELRLLFNQIDKGNVISISPPKDGCYISYHGESVEELYSRLYRENKSNKKLIKGFIILISTTGGKPLGKNVSNIIDLQEKFSEEEWGQIEKEIASIVEEASRRWGHDGTQVVAMRYFNIQKNKQAINWKKLLKKLLSDNCDEDYTYDKPERKYLHMDMILPGMFEDDYQKRLNKVWTFIDTSGSISDYTLEKYLSNLYQICEQFRCSVNVAFWDTAIEKVYENVQKNELEKCKSNYAGGTYAECIYDYLDENRIDANAIIIFSDGYFEGVGLERTAKYKNKTLVVIDESCPFDHSNMGYIAKCKE